MRLEIFQWLAVWSPLALVAAVIILIWLRGERKAREIRSRDIRPYIGEIIYCCHEEYWTDPVI